LPVTLMLSWLRPLKSNFIVAPLSTLKFPVTFIVLMPPTPPGIRVPARFTSPLAVMAPPALTVPPPEPRVALVNPLQSSVPPVLALTRLSVPAGEAVPWREAEPDATSPFTVKGKEEFGFER